MDYKRKYEDIIKLADFQARTSRNNFLEISQLKEQLANRNKTVFVGWIVVIFLIIMFIIK